MSTAYALAVTTPGAVADRIWRGLPVDRIEAAAIAGIAALGVFESMRRGVIFAEKISAFVIIGGLVVFCSRRPHLAVIGIVAWVPMQLPILAYLYKLGTPQIAVRYLGYLKEFWTVALLLAVLGGQRHHRSHRRLDTLDVVALGFIGIATSYLLLPFIAPGTLGGQNFQVRLNAWRAEALFVVVFFLVRQLAFPESWFRRVRTTVFVVAIVLAGFGIWEQVDSAGFKNFVNNTLDYSGYSAAVLNVGNNAAGLFGLSPLGNSAVLRVGSLLNSPLILGFFMLIPFGLGLERLRGQRVPTLAAIATVGAGTAIILSLTRSAALGAGVAAVLAVGFSTRRSPGRVRLLIALVTAAVVLLPAAADSSINARFQAIFSGDQTDDSQEHIDASRSAVNLILARPQGTGLGSNTGTASRFQTGIPVTAENSYLETGAELGLAAIILLVSCVLLLLVQLRARSKVEGVGGELAAGAWLGGCGLALGACFLQTWLEIPTALVFWTISGMALAEVTPDRHLRVRRLGTDDASTGAARRRMAARQAVAR